MNSDRSNVPSRHVLGQRVDATSYAHATERVLAWAEAGESRYVCVANVHVVMEGWDDREYRGIVNGGDLITPDGVPLVWSLRAFGVADAVRVYGPDLTLHICEAAAGRGLPVGLYGGREESLRDFVAFLEARYPGIEVACAISPPFRPLSADEDATFTEAIERSGARILFVGIGCPKQERWMAAHKGRLPMPMLGVGAAFDFHGGRVKQSPAWMQRCGLEWLFRLCMEPKRLWRRYAWHNPRFLLFFGWQYIADKLGIPLGGRFKS